MVDNDRDGYRACPDKASNFVRWTEEGPTKIMGVVEDGDPLCAACHNDDVEGLIELCHFFVGICFEVHRAGETGNVPVAGLVHHGERVEESCPGGVEGHDGVFLSSTSATRRAMTRGYNGNNDNDEMPSPRGFEIKFVATPLQSSSHETWRGGRFLPIPSPSYCLQIT
jgi:hypothetical protein